MGLSRQDRHAAASNSQPWALDCALLRTLGYERKHIVKDQLKPVGGLGIAWVVLLIRLLSSVWGWLSGYTVITAWNVSWCG